MEQIIKIRIDGNKLEIAEEVCSTMKDLFSGCRVNFLLGAGFSANLLGVLNNNEIVFEALRQFIPADDTEKKKATILSAYLYWSFFSTCIAPIAAKVNVYDPSFEPYKTFGNILYRIFSERGNPVLDRQFNIFTTNYDPIIEMVFDHSNCICNDGFEGRIQPLFSTDNYAKSYYRQAVFSNRKAEIPSLNLLKLHGSITWSNDIIDGGIKYQDYVAAVRLFSDKYLPLFNTALKNQIDSHFTASNQDDATDQIKSLLGTAVFDSTLTNADKYEEFLQEYKFTFLIVNPTKEKFSDTLLNKNYYELLRIFSNELEKENTLLVVNGFSFRDEHIQDLVKRSMVNPSLKVIIFCYKEDDIEVYKNLLATPKNNNITYVCSDGENLTLDRFNEILFCVHG